MQSSSDQPLVGEEHYVTTLITASKETIFNLDYLCFYYYLLSRNCTVRRKSCHDYSSSRLSYAFRSVVEKNKCVIHQPRSVRIGETMPSVLSIQDLGHSFSQYGPPGW